MLHVVDGDCTEPLMVEGSNNIICHCVNDLGVYGSGVVMAIHDKWQEPMNEYTEWYKNQYYIWCVTKVPFKQGQCQLIKVEEDLYVANLVAQSGMGKFYGLPAVRYGALEESLLRLKYELLPVLKHLNTTLHFPEICCGRAGASLDKVQEIINRVFPDLTMYMYQYEGRFK